MNKFVGTGKRIVRWLLLAVAGYVSILVLLMLFESKIVYPAPRGGSRLASESMAEDVSFRSADGTRLHGWYFEKPDAASTIVFFHGNAESVDTSGPWICQFASSLNASVFIFDYRGYGKSEGRPSEKGVVEDGVAAIDWLSNRTGLTSDQMVFFGRSLGGGVAIQVAKQKPPRAFVLVSTFSSIVDVACEQFSWLPIRLVMKNRYESEQAITEMDIPILQIHGDRDQTISMNLGKRLNEASPSQHKSFVVAQGKGHNNLNLESFRQEINDFLPRRPLAPGLTGPTTHPPGLTGPTTHPDDDGE